MPTVQNAMLELTTIDDNTTVSVAYEAVFTPFERQLAGLGWECHEHLEVFGVDPPNSVTGDILAAFPQTRIAVSVGAGPLIVPRSVQMTVPRRTLQEDTGGDDDEIRVRIRIHSPSIPPAFTADVFTDQERLLG